MDSGTIGGSIGWALWYVSEIAFKWVPGAVVSTVGTSPVPVDAPAPTTLSQPVTAPQVVQYLQTASAPGVYDNLFHAWSSFVAFSTLATLGFLAIVVYTCVRVFQIRQMERRRVEAAQHTVASHDIPKTQLRWERVVQEGTSDNERDWRIAILEADIMLNELLDTQGFRGETIADKLRAAEPANFRSLNYAWEAHKFRNKIAHESNTTLLSAREVRRVLSMYEAVFKEFHFL